MGLPCDKRSQLCSTNTNEVTRLYTCPFDTGTCGSQTIDVSDTENEFYVNSANFKNFTMCGYQFRNLNSNFKQINIKVVFGGNRLEFKVVQGDTI